MKTHNIFNISNDNNNNKYTNNIDNNSNSLVTRTSVKIKLSELA